MKLSIIDLDVNTAVSEFYDLALYSSGYERRSRFIPPMIKGASKAVAIGFSDHINELDRPENDSYFRSLTGSDVLIAEPNDDAVISAILKDILGKNDNAKIFVDISSMSRSWYAAVLNWARFRSGLRNIEIVFGYSHGSYSNNEFPSRVISGISCISGCEGQPGPTRKSVAVFGLGYDQHAPLAVLDYLEPDVVYAYYGTMHEKHEHLNRALEVNKAFIDHVSGSVVTFNTLSVREAYLGIIELSSAYIRDSNVILIPLGPKTHVLGSMLAAMRFADIACLHVSGRFRTPVNIEASGDIAACRVTIERSR